jgi:pimeloyl-ACP methyl ester carboxylesterase
MLRTRWSLLLLSVVPFLVAACGSAAPVVSPAPTRSDLEVAIGCKREAQGGTPVHFDSVDGARLGGLMLGTGTVGVVLVHQIDASHCQWLPYGKQLADRGYRVLLIDLGGYGSSEPDQDVKQAVGNLRQQGLRSIVLIGASLGGTASLSAAVISPAGPDRRLRARRPCGPGRLGRRGTAHRTALRADRVGLPRDRVAPGPH